MKKKLFSLILSLVMMFTMMPTMSFAESKTKGSVAKPVIVLRATAKGSKALVISWAVKNVPNRTKYSLYGAKVTKLQASSKLKAITNTINKSQTVNKIAKKKLAKGKYYQFEVRATVGGVKYASNQ